MSGLFAAICAYGAVVFVPFLVSGGITAVSGGWLAVALSALLLSLATFLALFNAGPRLLSLDLQKRHYALRQGLPLLTWTQRGPTEGSELSINRAKSGSFQVRFRASGWKGGLPLEIYMTEADARILARHLANELGVSVRGDAH